MKKKRRPGIVAKKFKTPDWIIKYACNQGFINLKVFCYELFRIGKMSFPGFQRDNSGLLTFIRLIEEERWTVTELCRLVRRGIRAVCIMKILTRRLEILFGHHVSERKEMWNWVVHKRERKWKLSNKLKLARETLLPVRYLNWTKGFPWLFQFLSKKPKRQLVHLKWPWDISPTSIYKGVLVRAVATWNSLRPIESRPG